MAIQPIASAAVPTRECHVLTITAAKGMRSLLLDASTYSLGRDPKNSIVLPEVNSVSRFHAMLLRMPDPHRQGHRYRIVDGDISGKPSTNGVVANGTRNSSYTLKDGDIVTLGEIKLSYRILVVTMAELEVMVTEGVDIAATLLLKTKGHEHSNAPVTQLHQSDSRAKGEGEAELPATLFFRKNAHRNWFKLPLNPRLRQEII